MIMTTKQACFLVTVASLWYRLPTVHKGSCEAQWYNVQLVTWRTQVLSCTGSFGFFHRSVLGQDTSELQPSTVETQEIYACEKSRHDMLKAVSMKCNFTNQR